MLLLSSVKDISRDEKSWLRAEVYLYAHRVVVVGAHPWSRSRSVLALATSLFAEKELFIVLVELFILERISLLVEGWFLSKMVTLQNKFCHMQEVTVSLAITVVLVHVDKYNK